MTRQPEVDRWFESYENPMKEGVQRVREIILDADPRMDECIKWSTPTFTYKGNLASFNPKSKAHVSVLFHSGASIPGDFPRLEGTGDAARTMKLADRADIEVAKPEIEAIVNAWCDSRQ
jgi:hypothetical protein